MIILDTNVISEVMKPMPEARVMEWLRGHVLEDLATTAVSAAEIGYGLRRLPPGRRRNDLETRYRTFLARGFGDRIVPSTRPRPISTLSWSPAARRRGARSMRSMR